MAALTKGTLFPAALETELFNKVKGHSSLARLSGQEALPFNGKDIFTFNYSNDISLVGEGAEKPAGDAVVSPVQMRPVKVVYQMRVSEEYMYAEEEAKTNTLKAFVDGFAAKLAAGLDKMAMHGINPATGSAASSIIGTNHFDSKVTNTVNYVAASADANIDAAVALVEAAEYPVTGIAISPAMRSAIAALTTNGARKYEDFAFGGTPNSLGSMQLDVNATVATGSVDHGIVGDFENAFRWGIAKEIPMEIIQYGNPDGQGDLKQTNQVVIRAEAYIGWAIMDGDAFARVIG